MKTFGWFVSLSLLMLLLVGVSIGAEVAGYKWYLPWKKDQEYALIRRSNEFVDSKQAQINGLVSEYNDLTNSINYYSAATPVNQKLVDGFVTQQRAKVLDMCDAASKINDDQVPEAAKPLMRSANCWNGN